MAVFALPPTERESLIFLFLNLGWPLWQAGSAVSSKNSSKTQQDKLVSTCESHVLKS